MEEFEERGEWQARIEQKLEDWRTSLEQEAESKAAELWEDYEAQIRAGLIDPDKIEKYIEIRRAHIEDVFNREPHFDPEAEEVLALEIEQEKDLVRFWSDMRLISGHQVPYYYNGCDAYSFKNASPHKESRADLKVKKSCADRKFWLFLKTKTNNCKGICWAIAGTQLNFKYVIPSLSPGRIEVEPYVIASGIAGASEMLFYQVPGKPWLYKTENPLAGFWPPTGRARIEIVTELEQKGEKPSSSGTTLFETTSWELFDKPPESTPKGFCACLSSSHGCTCTGFRSKASMDIAGGTKVFVTVSVSAFSHAVGHTCIAGIDMNTAGKYISVPFLRVNFTPFPAPLQYGGPVSTDWSRKFGPQPLPPKQKP